MMKVCFCKANLCYSLIFQLILMSTAKQTIRLLDFIPQVRLSTCQFGNKNYDSICSGNTNGSLENLEIPKTFRQLEFTCSASYPTEWVFENPLVNEKNIVSVNITKSRTSGVDPSQDIFESVLLLKFKYSTNVPNFACNSVSSVLEFDTRNVAEQNEYSNSPSALAETYFSTRISSLATDDSIITLRRFHTLSQNRRKQPSKNTSNLCKYRIQFDQTRNTFRCASPDHYEFLPVQFIASSSLDESNQIFNPEAYGCSENHMLDSKTVDNLLDFTGSGIIACGKEPSFVVKHYYFPLYNKTEVVSSNLYSPASFLVHEIVDVSYNSEVFRGYHAEFTCRVPSFFFSKGIKWSLPSNNASDSISSINFNRTVEYYDEGAIISIVTVHISQNTELKTLDVTCHAPVANSKEWINNTVQVNLMDGMAPEVPSLHIKTIVKGEDSYKQVTCKSFGKPQPQFVWIAEGLNLTHLILASRHSNSNITRHACKLIRNCLIIENNGSTSVMKVENIGANHDWKAKKENITCEAINIFGTKEGTILYSQFSNFHWTITSIAVAFILIVVLVVVVAYYKVKSIRELTDTEIEHFMKGEPSSKDPTLWPYDMRYEIPRKDFQIANTVLGKGISGIVTIGKYGSKIVAIKTTKTTKDNSYLHALLKEVKMLCYLGVHDNIINLIGSCTENIRKREVYILLEFCSNGSMLEYIKGVRHNFIDRYTEENRGSYVMYQNGVTKNLSTRDLLRWASEIADGCSFLSARKVIHGDLAARNVLITDSLQSKVGDFGLSKELIDYSIYVRQNNCPLPLKWMAVESLRDFEFSIESDIWSYGITLWELFSLGDVPYPGVDWNYESYKLLIEGYRMEKPKYADNKTYDMMKLCWNEKPKLRPKFSQLREFFNDQRNLL